MTYVEGFLLEKARFELLQFWLNTSYIKLFSTDLVIAWSSGSFS